MKAIFVAYAEGAEMTLDKVQESVYLLSVIDAKLLKAWRFEPNNDFGAGYAALIGSDLLVDRPEAEVYRSLASPKFYAMLQHTPPIFVLSEDAIREAALNLERANRAYREYLERDEAKKS